MKELTLEDCHKLEKKAWKCYNKYHNSILLYHIITFSDLLNGWSEEGINQKEANYYYDLISNIVDQEERKHKN